MWVHVKYLEEHFGGHGDETDGKVPDGEIDDEDVDSAQPASVPRTGKDRDDDHVAEEREKHEHDQRGHFLDHAGCPHGAVRDLLNPLVWGNRKIVRVGGRADALAEFATMGLVRGHA